MQFHPTHGASIQLSEARTVATRSKDTFCHGIVFSDQPLSVDQTWCLQLGCTTSWTAALRLGVTSVDPKSLDPALLPKFAYPDLAVSDGFWIRIIPSSIVTSGCHLSVSWTSLGQLHVQVYGQHKWTLLSGLPTNELLWLILDLYGNTISAKILQPDGIPKEILARGPAAVSVFERTCSSGTQPFYRTRLMIVGQENAGKTSLKQALIGQSYRVKEVSSAGMDLSSSFNVSLGSSWTLNPRPDRQSDSVLLESLDDTRSLLQEHRRAIATNIALEQLANRRYHGTTVSANQPVLESNQTTPHLEPSEPGCEITQEPLPASLLDGHILDKIQPLVHEIIAGIEARKDEAQETECSQRDAVILDVWDFAGQTIHYITQQMFLTSRAIYCVVFNLCDDVSVLPQDSDNKESSSNRAVRTTAVQHLDMWMRSIHAHAAENSSLSVEDSRLSPPIFIVGTHRDSLHTDPAVRTQMVQEKFDCIQEYMAGKPYIHQVRLPFFAVENNMEQGEDPELVQLRQEIQSVAASQTYMGQPMPARWLSFEEDLTKLVMAGVNFASYNQVYEMAVNHHILSTEEVQAMLNLYHDLGVILYYGSHVTSDYMLSNTVVLNPQWLVDKFRQVTASSPPKDKWGLVSDKWSQLIDHGVLEDTLLPNLWPDSSQQTPFLLGLMTKFDLICPRLPPSSQSQRNPGKSWYVPSRFGPFKSRKKVYAQTVHDAVFYIDFNGFLPEGLFHRVQARLITWSQERGGRDLYLAQGIARVFVDPDHDLLVEMCAPHLNRIKVLVMHVKDKEATSSKRSSGPVAEVVAKVRHFLEAVLTDLKNMWIKRLFHQTCIACPCSRTCRLHEREACLSDECLHFLDLDECLTNQIVCCEHRRVKTDQFKQWFPAVSSGDFKEPVIATPATVEQSYGNIERNMPTLPDWLKGAAKLLSGAPENQDWLTLARLMGYKQNRIDLMSEDLNPALVLLTDWIVSSGNTTMSVDILLHYLQQLALSDVVDVINRAKDYELEKPTVFISYQWDVQDEVSAIRDHLEKMGFSCWMDIGQMGGGDRLSSKIEQGLRGCEVVVACITPKYTASQLCNRELWLADVLQKPIIPILMELMSWPPPGGMSVILSQLVFINMKGVGGHGGSGIHADLKDKYSEIAQRVSLHAKPDHIPCVDTTITMSPQKVHEPDKLYPVRESWPVSRTSVSSLSQLEFQGLPGYSDPPANLVQSTNQPLISTNNSGNIQTQRRNNYNNNNPVPQAHFRQCSSVCSLL